MRVGKRPKHEWGYSKNVAGLGPAKGRLRMALSHLDYHKMAEVVKTCEIARLPIDASWRRPSVEQAFFLEPKSLAANSAKVRPTSNEFGPTSTEFGQIPPGID